MEDITLDLRGPGQGNQLGTDLSVYTATHENTLTRDRARDMAGRPDANLGAAYVAIDDTIDLDFPLTRYIACNAHVRANDRRRHRLALSLNLTLDSTFRFIL